MDQESNPGVLHKVYFVYLNHYSQNLQIDFDLLDSFQTI